MVNASQFNNPGGQMGLVGGQMIPSPVNLPPRYPTQLDGGQGMVQQQQQGGPMGGGPSNGLPSGVGVMGGPGMQQQQLIPTSGMNQVGGGNPGMVTSIAGPAVGGAPVAPPSADPEKRKLIQQQLVLLLHAHKCQRRDREQQQQPGVEVRQCTLPHCRTMKDVLLHMTTCQAGKNCSVPHCSSSRQIIAHWKHCNRQDCPVCLPLKQADTRRNPGDMISPPGQPLGGGMQQQQQLQQQQQMGNIIRPTGPGMPPGMSGMTSPRMPQQQQPQQQPQQQSFINRPPTAIVSSGPQYDRIASTLMDSTRINLPDEIQNTVSAAPIQSTKEWHNSVTPDLRNHLVHKLVQVRTYCRSFLVLYTEVKIKCRISQIGRN